MDPNTCFERIIGLLACGDHEEAFYACGDLINWLNKGGFPPAGFSVSAAPKLPPALKELRRLLKRSQEGA